MKVGRNEPCPCGSGKKYKKCCALRPTELSIATPPAFEPAADGRSSSELVDRYSQDLGLTPYAVARMIERPDILDHVPPAQRADVERGIRDSWTIGRVDAMTTDAIVAQLDAYGIVFDEEAFRAAAASRWSAWTIGDEWRASGATCRGKQEDFLGLAACTLWKRLMSERPSVELLDDWMQQGYDLVEAKRPVEAAELWWRFWQTLRARFTPAMRDERSTEVVFRGYQFLSNWTNDFVETLEVARARDPRFAAIGRDFAQQWLAQFVGADELSRVNMTRALAECLARLGEEAAAERALLELVETYPRNAWCYVALADGYSHSFPSMLTLPRDDRRARDWLNKGLAALPKGDRDRSVLSQRLKQLAGP